MHLQVIAYLCHKSVDVAYRLQDLVWLGLSPEWQHSVNEWRTTRHPVDSEWIWRKLISTMGGWQRPDEIIYFKTVKGNTVSLNVHSTWKVAGVESLLEVVHDIPSSGLRMIHGWGQLKHSPTLREVRVQENSTVHLTYSMLGD